MTEAPGRVTLWMVEIFAAIAAEGSIGTAARRVGASASTVSQQLAKLEAGLGTQLVDRAARPLRLTPAGETFLRRARRILDEAALARAELARGDLSALMRFRLGMIEDFEADVTPRLLSDMAGALDRSRFLLETGPSHRLLSALDEGALDVVVAADTGEPAEGLEMHPLLREPFVAAVPLAVGTPVASDLSALAGLPFLHYSQRLFMGRQIAAHLARQNVALSPRFELDSYHAILAMVADGAGWTILTPLGLHRAQRFADRVAVVPLPLAPLSRQIALWARREVLGDMAGATAARLRPILADLIVGPARARWPWLGDALRVEPGADPVAAASA